MSFENSVLEAFGLDFKGLGPGFWRGLCLGIDASGLGEKETAGPGSRGGNWTWEKGNIPGPECRGHLDLGTRSMRTWVQGGTWTWVSWV